MEMEEGFDTRVGERSAARVSHCSAGLAAAEIEVPCGLNLSSVWLRLLSCLCVSMCCAVCVCLLVCQGSAHQRRAASASCHLPRLYASSEGSAAGRGHLSAGRGE